ncbi:DUF4350 domain-containing protein [Mucilaginibacter sp. BJC16-A38]|uniref:DUF4350 domain-containing protein n=1 Tax=Mucilaginibacter phenanthrenivorans TaxID=1234842 RepID=UPI002157062A|nr:DUF4350 domain-containing protein [Mucilaginibacter phenanthrenivorans]MCR8558435.1 DUF4350 domain-containing protein [Mucilaginibacter phenanthrenivorans]
MKDFKIYFSVAIAVLLVYLVAQYNRPIPVNWKPTLYYKDKIPYGTYVVYNQLNAIFPSAKIVKTNASVYHAVHDSIITAGNYLIIAKAVKLNKFDFTQLVKYIKAGNSVFMASFTFDGFLADTLKLSTSFETAKNQASLNFTSNQLKQASDYTFGRDISNQFFSSFDTAKAVVVGKNNSGHSTYLSFKFGKGSLYISANPLIFSNISLLKGKGADYVAKALSYLPETSTVYWDEFQNGDIPEDESPMRVFFSNPNLQWAYYLSLFGLLVFVLFEIKRRQRVIPIIEPLKNSTLEFVNVVGQVYYEQRNNNNIAHKKILYLLTYLRDKYNLKVNKIDTEFAERLTAKLGIDSRVAQDLVNYINYISVQQTVSDRDLIELNRFIEKFYTQAS